MSADNWAECPRCKYRAKLKFEKESDAVQGMYGKVSVEEFDAARAALELEDVGHTFREDYEFYGAEGGEITAEYSGHCTRCDLGLDFKHERRFWSPSEERAHA
jgi:hypothetical protein